MVSEVAIFWDYENCPPPSQMNGYEVIKRIRSIAHNFGTVKLFKAYLELSDPAAFAKSLALRSELQASGVSLTDCPHNGRKDVADKMILVDMLAYAIDNPAPSSIMLISGDRDFAYAVSVLRLRRCHVVLVSFPMVHASLKSQASAFYDWTCEAAEVNTDFRCSVVTEETQSCRSKRIRSNSRIAKSPQKAALNTLDLDKPEIDIMDHLSLSGKRVFFRGGPREDAVELEGWHDSLSRSQFQEDGDMKGSIRTPSRTESVPETWFPRESAPKQKFQDYRATPVIGSVAAAQQDNISIPKPTDSPAFPVHGHTKEQPLPPVNFSLFPAVEFVQDAVGCVSSSTTFDLKIASSKDPHVPRDEDDLVLGLVESGMATPSGEESAASAPSQIETRAPTSEKVVPLVFRLLVERLEYHRSVGFLRPLRSKIAIELITDDSTVYRRVGVERFGKYVALAEKQGIIELGGRDGGAWISLHPDWYDAKLD